MAKKHKKKQVKKAIPKPAVLPATEAQKTEMAESEQSKKPIKQRLFEHFKNNWRSYSWSAFGAIALSLLWDITQISPHYPATSTYKLA